MHRPSDDAFELAFTSVFRAVAALTHCPKCWNNQNKDFNPRASSGTGTSSTTSANYKTRYRAGKKSPENTHENISLRIHLTSQYTNVD